MEHLSHAGRNRRMSRRTFLGSCGMVGGILALGSAACTELSPRPTPPTPTPRRRVAIEPLAPPPGRETMSEWSRYARLANAAGLGEDPTDEEMRLIIQGLLAQNVSVAEADTVLSDWLEDEEFEGIMAAVTHFNQLAHGAGLKTVWYYPSLEVITPNGEYGPSFYKTFPDWAQIAIDGKPNVFHGGVVFWVDPGNESVWLSPNGPWREYYLRRVRRLARTGADGLWPDVPLYFGGVVSWCDHSTWGKAAFKADTGLDVPIREDWGNPVWRRWIEWRHCNLNQFLIDVAAAGRSENPEFETFVETVTMDYSDATTIGLDGAYLRLADGVTHSWEVDVVSEDDGMRHATDDDWICLISMYKYARAASGAKPAWAFSYGLHEDDAVQVMAECLAAGCNPYEVRTPEKTAGVSAPMRTRMYAFVKANTERLFDATTLARVALYHSSASRDYVRPSSGTGLFASTTKPPGVEKWWSTIEEESCYRKQWLSEYRGILKALVHGHIPFDVVTSPTLRAADLNDYRLLVAPDLEAVSDGEAAIMRRFVQDGGALLVTGPNPTGWTEYGDERPEYALADVFGISKATPRPLRWDQAFGAGWGLYFSDLPGREYLRSNAPSEYGGLVSAIRQHAPPVVNTDADRRIHLEARRLAQEWLLHFTNLTGVRGGAGFTVAPTSFQVVVEAPRGEPPAGVAATSPDSPSPDEEHLQFSFSEGKLSFRLGLRQYALVVIRWGS